MERADREVGEPKNGHDHSGYENGAFVMHASLKLSVWIRLTNDDEEVNRSTATHGQTNTRTPIRVPTLDT